MPLFIFLIYPACEVLLWWKFIASFGFLDAVLWCVLSGFVGLLILKSQGGGALAELQKSVATGQLPSSLLAHRIVMSLGGLLLMLPGILTDVVGALLILPGFRHLLVWFIYWKMASSVLRAFSKQGPLGSFVFQFGQSGFSQWQQRQQQKSQDPNVIDVEAEVINDPELPVKR